MPYENEIIYGPVDSRRLGKSLGINLSPLDRKVCSFDCVYCSGGPTRIRTLDVRPDNTFSLDYVKEELQRGFSYHKQNGTPIDYVSVVGATEPTIYPKFLEFVDLLFFQLNQYFPKTPTAVFTNSTNLDKEEIRYALQRFHRRFFKLDAGDEETFQRINRPAESLSLANIVENISKMQDVELSVGVIDSFDGNYTSLQSDSFLDSVKRIKPIRVYIYDMDRPTPIENGFKMMRTSEERLVELADLFSGTTGIETSVLRAKKSRGIHELVRSLYSYQQRGFLHTKGGSDEK